MTEEKKMQFQTRDESGELRFFETAMEAFTYAQRNKDVWKISFENGVRLVRKNISGLTLWEFLPLIPEVKKALREMGYEKEEIDVIFRNDV